MRLEKLGLFLDNLFIEYSGKVPGASVGIVFGNNLILTRSYGLANLKTKEATSEKTNFRLASVSKQFTGTCILQLIDKGRINLNDKIIKYFPQFKNAQNVTIFHLLTHTSGFLDYEDLLRKNRKNPISDKEVLNLISRQKKIKFEPGKSWSYNNGNYCILKELIEKASFLSYGEYLRKYIFEPLDMRNTILSERNKTKITNRAIGYSEDKNKFIQTDNDATSFTMGDGSIYSNIEDLTKWVIGRKKLISKELYMLSQSPLVPTDEEGEYYGLGLNIANCAGNKTIYHDGYSIGFRSSVCLIPCKKIGIIFLSNLHKNEGSDFTNKIVKFILSEDIFKN